MADQHRWAKHHYLLYGVPITILVLLLFFYWFRIANRSIVFLVDHDMGPLVTSTAPFSYITRSRYWMAGFVASGAVMVLYLGINTVIRIFNRSYTPPTWQVVWVVPALAITVGIPLITTTTTHAPRLPFGFTLWVTAVALIGLALALLPGTLAGQRPFETALISVDGIGLSLVLIGASAIENIRDWLDRGAQHFIVLSVVLILAGIAITLVMTGFRYALKTPPVPATTLFLAGICVTYPGLSILHHVMFTDGYFYITDSDNFFARNLPLQVGIWIVTAIFCVGLARLRDILETYRADR